MHRRTTMLALAAAVAVAATPALGAGDAGPARVVVRVETVPAPGAPPQVQHARVEVTGTGLPPRRVAGTAQGRLMARRAAVVDGYRKIAAATERWRVEAGGTTYYEPTRTTAFVRGAAVETERYFSDGRVEVDLSAPPPDVLADPSTPDGWQHFRETAGRAGITVVTEPVGSAERREISRDEWEQFFAARRAATRDSEPKP